MKQSFLLPALLLAARPAAAQNFDFPAGIEFVNVRQAPYNAYGDGVHDDTQALQAAITDNLGRTVYLPNGTYLVSNRLVGKSADGNWNGGLRLMGQSEAGAVIRLQNNCPGYQSAAAPKAVVYTASSLFVETPYGGGKDYPALGEGNEAYNNYLDRLTIDTGTGNAGAIGLDYLANNAGAVRHVTIRGGGVAGLSLARKWVGPCLIKHLTVQGFQYGVKTANGEYGITLEHVNLSGQMVAAVYNSDNILSMRDVASANAVPALVNTAGLGLVTLLDGAFTGGAAGSSAVVDDGTVLLRNVNAGGYARAATHNGTAVPGTALAEFVSDPVPAPFGGPNRTLGLPVQETPEFHDNDLTHWVNVLDRGAVRNDWNDDSGAIQQALNAGQPVVYFPPGRYFVSGTLTVPPTVHKVVAYGVTLAPTYNAFANAAAPAAVFRVQGAGTNPVIFAGINLDKLHQSASQVGMVGWENATTRPLALQDLAIGESKAAYRTLPGAGPLFLENVVANGWELGAGQQTWARQLDLEGAAVPAKVANAGGQLWVLGWKTEGQGLVFDNQTGARSEILGGLCYPAGAVPATAVFCRAADAQVALAYASSAFANANDYPTIVSETRGPVTRALDRSQAKGRGVGRVVPLYSSANAAGMAAQVAAPAVLGVYPNPARTEAAVVGTKALAAVALLDNLGRAVGRAERTSERAFRLHLAGLPAGLYQVRTQTVGGHVQTNKLIVE